LWIGENDVGRDSKGIPSEYDSVVADAFGALLDEGSGSTARPGSSSGGDAAMLKKNLKLLERDEELWLEEKSKPR